LGSFWLLELLREAKAPKSYPKQDLRPCLGELELLQKLYLEKLHLLACILVFRRSSVGLFGCQLLRSSEG
jgi:hypothetical protein